MKLFGFIKGLINKNDESITDYISVEQKNLNTKNDESTVMSKNNIDSKKDENGIEQKNAKFSFKMGAERKQHIAEKIIENSNVDKMYWIQLIIACMLATLGLLSNSIPVIIGSMLVSPILTPIQSFAFAIVCGKKHMYLQSLKILVLSLFIAISSSFLVCYLIPFASLTEQVLLRGTPTVLDLAVALLSGIIAFLFLSNDKLEESIVGIAIAVSLIPPLAAVGIGLHFMDFSVAQGSFLLFITNLIGILLMGVCVFYLFGFKPTSRTGKKRTEITLVMVLVLVVLIIVPLWKSMSQIASDQKTTNIINSVSEEYLNTLQDGIVINSMSFRNLPNNLVRVTVKLDVPYNFTITNSHKEELTKKLSDYLQKSVELDLEIVEISSVYIDDIDNREKTFIKNASSILNNNGIILIDSKILSEGDIKFFFLDVYSDLSNNKNDIYPKLVEELNSVYESGVRLVLQWQENTNFVRIEKTQAEIDLEKQFFLLFSGAELEKLELNYSDKMQDEMYVEIANLYIEFKSPYPSYRTKQILSEWKTVISEYLGVEVEMKVKFEEINLLEI